MMDKSISFLHEKLINKEVTSDELVKEALEKSHEVQASCNAFVTILDEAKGGEVTDNLLSGIPYGIKDNYSTKDMVCSASSNTLKNYVPFFDATVIEKSLGMSDTLVGLTIVAIGSSLPELVTSIVAAQKGDSGIALGNAVGSCIFNILFILGAAATLTPIRAVTELVIDAGILIGVSILVLIFVFTKKEANRWEGAFCVFTYVVYSVYIIMR